MNNWKIILATMVIFGAGVLTGGLLVRNTLQKHPSRPAVSQSHRQPTFAVPNAGGVRIEFLRRIQRELDLTPEQRSQVDRIIGHSQERTRRLMENVSPQLRQEVQRAKAEFRDVLTQPQKVRFDELIKQPQRPREGRGDKLDRTNQAN